MKLEAEWDVETKSSHQESNVKINSVLVKQDKKPFVAAEFVEALNFHKCALTVIISSECFILYLK